MKKRWKNPNVIALGVENTYDMENYSIAPPFPSQDGKQPTRIKCGLCEKVFESVNDFNAHVLAHYDAGITKDHAIYLYS